MIDPAAGTPSRTGSAEEARDTPEVRGPSRVATGSMPEVERIRTIIETDHEGTAAEPDALGLAEYFAMEAYVVE